MVRIPQIQSIETAIRLYYERIELTNTDIRELFGKISGATISKLKETAREKMREENAPVWNARWVRTDSAYRAWGLNIDDLEKRYARLRKFGLMKEA